MLATTAAAQVALSEYDVPFGNGIDPSTRRYILRPNPDITTVGGVSTGLTARNGSTTARIVFYTPSGSNTGPLNVTAWGVTYQYYTANTLAACKALMGTRSYSNTSRPPGYGDWLLFPAQTLTFPVNGETYYGDCNSQSGASKQYMTVYGTYDPAAMLDFTKWNTKQCVLDFTNVAYTPSTVNGISQFFLHQGRYESNFAFLNFTIKKTYLTNNLGFYSGVGARSGILFERCVTEAASIAVVSRIESPGLASNVGNKNLVTITSSGTTATATINAGFAAIVLAAQGTLQCCVTGDTSNKYNGQFLVTYVDSTHLSYTFPGSGNAPATGSVITLSAIISQLPDVICATDVVFNQCGLGYMTQLTGAHAINFFCGFGIKRLRFYDCVNLHGGWARTGNRNVTTTWNPGATLNPITSLSRSGTTITALTPTTAGLTTGGYVYVQKATGNVSGPSLVTGVVANTSFTYDIDANGAPAALGGASITGYLSGNTLNVSSVVSGSIAIGQLIYGGGTTTCQITAGSGSTWTFSGSTQTVGSVGSPVALTICPTWQDPAANGYDCSIGDPPDTYSHGFYIENSTYDIKIYRMVTGLECVNSKFTGGPYYLKDCVDIRGPISFITQPFGNDSEGNSWCNGATTVSLNHLQVFSQDVVVGSGYGFAAQFAQTAPGSSYSNALILNNSNNLSGSTSTNSRLGLKTFPATGGYASYAAYAPFGCDMRHSIMASWGPTDTSGYSTFSYNITDDTTALPGGTNLKTSTTQSAFQTAITNTLALDIANTFRAATPELAGVTVASGTGPGQGLNNAANLQTEQNCLDFMLYNPQIQWASKLQAHFRQYLGR